MCIPIPRIPVYARSVQAGRAMKVNGGGSHSLCASRARWRKIQTQIKNSFPPCVKRPMPWPSSPRRLPRHSSESSNLRSSARSLHWLLDRLHNLSRRLVARSGLCRRRDSSIRPRGLCRGRRHHGTVEHRYSPTISPPVRQRPALDLPFQSPSAVCMASHSIFIA